MLILLLKKEFAMVDALAFGQDAAPEKQLRADIEKMRALLKKIAKTDILHRTGAREENGAIILEILFQTYRVDLEDFSILNLSGESLPVAFESIFYKYLTHADGMQPAGQLISFRELPDGANYSQAFQGYAPDRLASYFGQDIAAFVSVCTHLGGKTVDFGDTAFVFDAFPRIPVTVVYYLGEDPFPPRASLLFDANVTHYMITAGLAAIGSKMVSRIIARHQAERDHKVVSLN